MLITVVSISWRFGFLLDDVMKSSVRMSSTRFNSPLDSSISVPLLKFVDALLLLLVVMVVELPLPLLLLPLRFLFLLLALLLLLLLVVVVVVLLLFGLLILTDGLKIAN